MQKANCDRHMEFGEKVKRARKEKKLSLAKIAELADISPSYVNRIEKGEKN